MASKIEQFAIANEARRKETDSAAKRSFLESNPTRSSGDMRCVGVVTLRELAQELRMDRSACRRYVIRLGYVPIKQRTSSSGFQEASTLTRLQADEIVALRRSEGC